MATQIKHIEEQINQLEDYLSQVDENAADSQVYHIKAEIGRLKEKREMLKAEQMRKSTAKMKGDMAAKDAFFQMGAGRE